MARFQPPFDHLAKALVQDTACRRVRGGQAVRGDVPSGALGFSSIRWDGRHKASEFLGRLSEVNNIKYLAHG